jgi:GntR family transcriptional regulator
MKLDDNSLTPLYQQVLEDIKAGIASGVYRPGNRIPSEPELSELYSVSRVTIRRAIEELVGEGYLTRRQGKGTYVNERKMARKLRQTSEVQSFTDLCASMSMTAGARVLDRRIVPVRSEEQRFFGPACQQLVFVSRVRTADGIPIMEEDNYLPLEGFSFLLEAPLEDVSIFGVIRDRTGREIAHNSESTIEIALASAAMAKTLEISPGDPLFFEHVFFTDQNGLPTCVSSKYLVGSRYIFAF